jgi:hypothetical protein
MQCVKPAVVFERCTRHSKLASTLRAHATSCGSALVRRTGAHVDDTSLPDGDDRVEIVFHDDDFTTMEFVEARSRIDEARAFARAAGMPLRITWRRVTADEPDR